MGVLAVRLQGLQRELIFKTGKVPVRPEETIEIFAFMEAADVSKENGGKAVLIEEVMNRAKAEAKKTMAKYSV